MTNDEFREEVLTHPQVRVVGSRSREAWCTAWEGPVVSTLGFVGIEDFAVDDRMVTVRAGTLVEDLLAETTSEGLGLPLVASGNAAMTQRHGTVGGLVMAGLPPFGPYPEVRDWVLAMEVLRGDGTFARVGAKVAKNVAGYDGHRFFAGTRGGLVALLSVTLRLWPQTLFEGLAAPDPQVEMTTVWHGGSAPSDASCGAVRWGAGPPPEDADWWIGLGGARSPSTVPDLERRAKSILDPEGRFVEGWQA